MAKLHGQYTHVLHACQHMLLTPYCVDASSLALTSGWYLRARRLYDALICALLAVGLTCRTWYRSALMATLPKGFFLLLFLLNARHSSDHPLFTILQAEGQTQRDWNTRAL